MSTFCSRAPIGVSEIVRSVSWSEVSLPIILPPPSTFTGVGSGSWDVASLASIPLYHSQASFSLNKLLASLTHLSTGILEDCIKQSQGQGEWIFQERNGTTCWMLLRTCNRYLETAFAKKHWLLSYATSYLKAEQKRAIPACILLLSPLS
jgi:hypothetical protein